LFAPQAGIVDDYNQQRVVQAITVHCISAVYGPSCSYSPSARLPPISGLSYSPSPSTLCVSFLYFARARLRIRPAEPVCLRPKLLLTFAFLSLFLVKFSRVALQRDLRCDGPVNLFQRWGVWWLTHTIVSAPLNRFALLSDLH